MAAEVEWVMLEVVVLGRAAAVRREVCSPLRSRPTATDRFTALTATTIRTPVRCRGRVTAARRDRVQADQTRHRAGAVTRAMVRSGPRLAPQQAVAATVRMGPVMLSKPAPD
jgi:hypothetical protein